MAARTKSRSECADGVGRPADAAAPKTAEPFDRYRLLVRMFDQAPGFIAIASGPEHRIEFCNQAYHAHVGHRKVIGLPVREVLPELESQGILDILDRVYTSGIAYTTREAMVTLFQPDGTIENLCMTLSYTPIKEEDGTVFGILYEGIDTTEEKRAKEEVRRLHGELIHMSRLSAMGTMASTLAHELNQPLTAALNFCRAAGRLVATAPEQAAGAIHQAGNCIERAGGIIRSLRETTKRRPPCRSAASLAEIVREAATIGLSGHEDLQLSVNVPEELQVDVDRIQLEQVFINLMRNAAEAMYDSAYKSLTIEAAACPGEVVVSVTDRGPGLPPDLVAKLFEMTDSTKATGMGVGLSICRTIVDAHGGRIWAENNPMGGATFFFSIPELDGFDATNDDFRAGIGRVSRSAV